MSTRLDGVRTQPLNMSIQHFSLYIILAGIVVFSIHLSSVGSCRLIAFNIQMIFPQVIIYVPPSTQSVSLRRNILPYARGTFKVLINCHSFVEVLYISHVSATAISNPASLQPQKSSFEMQHQKIHLMFQKRKEILNSQM